MNDNENTYNVLLDTGATHSYVKKSLKFNVVEKVKPMEVISMHGTSIVNTKQRIKFLGEDIDFFELDNITGSDLILGLQGIIVLNALIDIRNMTLTVGRRKESNRINYTIGDDMYKERINMLMKENNGIGPLPFTTTIEATIRTKTDDPIWTKQYPYPIADNDFVNREIKRLIEDGIIQRSNSPYNSPIWTVPKKGLDEDGRPKKRMVIDYQKLNSHTITDRYIIPDVNMTIQNLGKAKYFTTLDLESGFHQVRIREEDREKTAFCVNGGKYEFIRMPFGLKNAPSIFQRCVDDILREYIGKFAYVYIDDVLIYSSSPEEHMKHIEIIFNALNKATLKVSDEKSKFFQTEVEYLGHIIKHNKIATNPEKVEAIEKYPLPQTLKDLRGFLGMTGYYRKFVQGYAGIAKPLTIHLRGDNGQIGKGKSAKTKIELDDAAIQAFKKLKQCLKEQVELFQPNYDKPFELTTDASNIAIGAVLSQMKKPIFFLSRTLSKTEENYSTNEKELLAIIWALQKLRNYIYGTTDLTIYTDHQSLTHAISEKNPNPKLKRWKAIIEDFGAKLVYKPGHQNVVADALSRQCINTSSIDTAHSAESSYTEIIKQVKQPLNAYAVQIELVPNKRINETRTRTIFSNRIRHTINFTNEQNLITELKKILHPNKTTAIHTTREDIYALSPIIKNTFNTANLVYTPTKLIDVREEEKQTEIVKKIHNRAHRGYKNNIQEILEKHYWPEIKQQCKAFNKRCTPCLYGKYERNPTREPVGESDIPTEPGKYIHMDIYFNDKKTFLVAIDKFSKYITLREIDSRERMSEKMEEVITNNYPNCTRLMTDNENCLNTPAVKMMCEKYAIRKIETPVYRSTSNGQVERAHSTISELARIFKIQNETTITEEIYKTIRELNNTIHTVTGQKPVDILFNKINYNKKDIYEKLKSASEKTLERLNQGTKHRTFSPNEQILVKIKGVRKKKDARYIKYIVKEDREDTVLTTKGKIVHKDNIKNYTINHNDHIPDITRSGHIRNQGRHRN